MEYHRVFTLRICFFTIHLFAWSLSVIRANNAVWNSRLTHWGRVTHICVGNLTITGSDNGLSPGRRQAIIWTNAGILLIGPLGTNFSEILIGIQTFSFKEMHLKMSSAKWRLFPLGLNELNWRLTISSEVEYYLRNIDLYRCQKGILAAKVIQVFI